MKNIEHLIDNLSWNLPIEVQKYTIKQMLSISDEDIPLLINDSKKETWHNAVVVLKKIGYPRIKLAIPKLIWLFQDYNWPGVETACEILKSVDKEILIPYIEDALQKADQLNDFMWIGGIKRLINIIGIGENDLDKKQIKLLEKADW